MRILLIDDELVALNNLKKRVDWLAYGFTEVLTAQDADQARQILADGHIDLVLSDIEMPGESGLALVESINKDYPDTESIIITCHADFNYIKKAMKAKVLDYVLKPIDYTELKTLLAQFAEQRKRLISRDKLELILQQIQPPTEPVDREGIPISPEDRIEFIKQFIQRNLREKLYVEDLARLVHINDQHLMRIFKKETGMSLTQYINEQRLLMAGHLLKHSDYNINYVADLVGFENLSYFTRLFKNTGFTRASIVTDLQNNPVVLCNTVNKTNLLLGNLYEKHHNNVKKKSGICNMTAPILATLIYILSKLPIFFDGYERGGKI